MSDTNFSIDSLTPEQLKVLLAQVERHGNLQSTAPEQEMILPRSRIASERDAQGSLSQENIAQENIAQGNIAQGNQANQFPLSLAQQRLWFLSQMDSDASAAYVISGRLRLQGELDVTALQQALDRIVVRHAVLRTHVAVHDGHPVQVVHPPQCCFPLTIWAVETPDEAESIPFEPLFDLQTGPLIQGQLIRLARDLHELRLAMHHLISDGWSMGIFIQELSVLYTAFTQNRPDPLPELAIQFGDYAYWQQTSLQGERLQTQQQYWLEQLQGAPECLTLPTDRPRPPIQQYAGANAAVSLPPELATGLRALSDQHGCTLFMTLLASWSVVMSRLSTQEDVVIGSPIAGRTRTEIEPLIGMFVNTQAMRVDLSENPDTTLLLAQVRAKALAAQSHQEIPFEQVVEAVAPARSLSHSPIFQVMFAMQNLPTTTLELPGLNLSPMAAHVTTAQFDLSLMISETDGTLSGHLNYATALFDETTVQRYLGYWKRLLQGMVADAHQPVLSLPIMNAPERDYLAHGLNNVHLNAGHDGNIDSETTQPTGGVHQLFEAQALANPAAIALVCADQQLSYGALNARANQLARYLCEKGLCEKGLGEKGSRDQGLRDQGLRDNGLSHTGIGTEGRVALCFDRGADLIVAMLAVLKAGGTYVPLDPGYPAERLQYILADSAPQILLTDGIVAEEIFGASLAPSQVIHVQTDRQQWATLPETNLSLDGLKPEHLAYIIYTSGSTGKPKGVMVEHANLINLVQWHNQAFDVKAGTCTSSVAGLGFDAAVWEIWPPLSTGASLTVPDLAISRDPEQLLDWWLAQPIEVGFLSTPIAELAFSRNLTHPTLRTLLVGGDRLTRFPPVDAGFTLVNNYGPTETTVVATSGVIDVQSGTLHIGRPIAHTQIYILDEFQNLVPQGVKGEVYIGGAGVARGYLNRPDLTEECFLTDPFSDRAGARMYRSGDLGRWLADGTVEYLGRNDDQSKSVDFVLSWVRLKRCCNSAMVFRKPWLWRREKKKSVWWLTIR
ncbi:amino acid adenylation domain-containing protein [Vibrio sp. PP-XX7]